MWAQIQALSRRSSSTHHEANDTSPDIMTTPNTGVNKPPATKTALKKKEAGGEEASASPGLSDVQWPRPKAHFKERVRWAPRGKNDTDADKERKSNNNNTTEQLHWTSDSTNTPEETRQHWKYLKWSISKKKCVCFFKSCVINKCCVNCSVWQQMK